VGAEDAAASQTLLEDFGLRVPRSPVPTSGRRREPEPMGRIRAFYLQPLDDSGEPYDVGVTLHAAWPVESMRSGEEVLAYGRNGLPVIVCRRVGQGRIVLIGDSGFAMNKNLEYVGGEPFDGRYENAQFWRWLIARVTGQAEWIPPRAEGGAAPAESADQEAAP
jgi:hypothetical protein